MHNPRLLTTAIVPFLLVAAGTAGYHFIEGWSFFDSLYMTVITLTTVGFGEVHPMSQEGRAFTMALVLGGVFTLFWAASEVIRGVVTGQFQAMLGRQRVERTLAGMEGHLIICGFGRMGRLVCQEFSEPSVPFVVIDEREEVLEGFALPHGVALRGDATSDALLKRAGIDRARALVSALPSDADNLYITMSARLLNEKLFVVARAENEEAEAKLTRAGASKVISPYVLGGMRVAQAVLRPAVLDFIDLATRTQHLELQLEEALVAPRSILSGKTLKESKIRQELEIIIVAIKRGTGKMIFNPSPDERIEEGDTLITLGHRHALDRLDALARA